MLWANFLHIYQPPTQKREILKKVVNESYRKIFAGLLKIPRAKVTLDFNSCLTEMLVREGYEDVVEMVRELARRKQVEFTGSAKYHPLLPKLPEEEIVRQINLDLETNKKFFGDVFQPTGFFPPEMAFNQHLALIIAKLGFKWLIVDEFSFPGQCYWDKTYKISQLPLKIYFRERGISFKILSAQLGTESMVIRELGKEIVGHRYLLTAMDGETFGHHRLGLEELLFELCRSPRFIGVLVSQLDKNFPEEEIVPIPSTWAMMRKDIERKMAFARWDDPENDIHKYQWELTALAIKAVRETKDSRGRELLDKSLHSDQYWWAGGKPWWSIEYIEAGAKELLEVVKLSSASRKIENRAQTLYYNILTTAFDWQRTGKISQMAKEEDEEVRQRTDEVLPKAKKAEINKMIASLKKQMLAAAKNQEYERAAQFRERIEELGEYLR